ncbi:MAG: hypothetical protein LR008_03595 [Candidatus Pacebacteria bacterium]|nr:hypothetical protein [Candidatus Paceibacterota bacterium]
MRSRKNRLIDPNTVVLLKHIGIGILVISSVVLIIVSIWYGTRVQALTIDSIQVRGGETISHEAIKILALNELVGTYLGLVPRQFTWFYPEDDIKQSVEKIDKIHNVTVNRIKATGILVTFEEYVPDALWCASVESRDCLFLDKNGYAFAFAPNLNGGSFLRFTQVGATPELNNSIATTEEFLKLKSLDSLLSERGWFVSQLELDKEGDAFVVLTDGGELKISLTQHPEKTVENLFVVLTSEEFSHIQPGNFQYIDLRFGNKVFVNEEKLIDASEITDEDVPPATIAE